MALQLPLCLGFRPLPLCLTQPSRILSFLSPFPLRAGAQWLCVPLSLHRPSPQEWESL